MRIVDAAASVAVGSTFASAESATAAVGSTVVFGGFATGAAGSAIPKIVGKSLVCQIRQSAGVGWSSSKIT